MQGLTAATVIDSGSCKLVASFIFGMTGMATHPMPFNIMRAGRFEQPLPKIPVGDILALTVFPPFFNPSVNPLGHPFFDILRIGGDVYRARSGQRFESGDGTEQLHAIIGGFRGVAG